MIESGCSEVGEERPDRHLILDCFQEGLTEVANAERVERAAIDKCQQRDQITNPEVTSPKVGVTSDAGARDHVEVGASLQVARNRWDCCEAVKGTGWWSRAIVENPMADAMVSSGANVPGKDCSLWVLGVDREICDGGADLIEIAWRVRDLPALERELTPHRRTITSWSVHTHTSVCGNAVIVKSVIIPWNEVS